MNNPTEKDKANRIKAQQLYKQAYQLETEKNYFAALERYRESLKLHEDTKTQMAYNKLLSTVGPR